MWAQKYPLRNIKILDNIRKVSEKSSSLFQVSASLSGLLRSGPGRSPALFPCAILLHKHEVGTKAVVILRCLKIPNDPNSPAFLRLVPDVGHKSRAGVQAHAVTCLPPVSMVSHDCCSQGLGVRRRLVPEGERCCGDTIAACWPGGELSTVPAAQTGHSRATGLREGDRELGPHGWCRD